MKTLGAFADAGWPAASDYKCSAVGTTVGTVVAGDLTTGSSAPQYVKIMSNVPAFLRWGSTGAAVPTSSVVDGSGNVEQVQANWMFQGQVNPGSTGWSLCFLTSGYATLSFYKK